MEATKERVYFCQNGGYRGYISGRQFCWRLFCIIKVLNSNEPFQINRDYETEKGTLQAKLLVKFV